MLERRGWLALLAVVVASFGVLLWGGHEIWRMAPPVPSKVVDAQGQVLFTKAQIQDGQSAWQSMGGQETGTVWGHGAYVAPDWSADQLHREALTLDSIFATRTDSDQARTRMRREMRHNGWDSSTGTVTISVERAQAVRAVASHWNALFGGDPSLSMLRNRYALRDTALPDSSRRADLEAFFWWTSWACVAQRPGGSTSYTNNWPHEPLVGNEPTSALLLWSMASVLALIAGIALLAVRHASARKEAPHAVPQQDPLRNLALTASMRAALPYFAVVALLLAAQVGLGGIVAHYGVEGNGFYGFRLDKFLPYAIGRTWHVQMGIFWIATSWLATGLFLSPAAGGREPKGQAVGVVALLGALLVVVVGSFAGEWMGVFQKLGFAKNFWLGHQGLAYVDLGRFWQILLLVGLVFWFWLVLRALLPALRKGPEGRSLVWLFALSAGAIALFYGAGLMWGRHTNLSMVEYWRWWVVHLWVEGFFEVFATAAIGFLFSRMGLVAARTAGLAAVEATAIFLGGGIIGTFHHLYFTGTPTSILALGSVFSALEIVPLALVGLEAVGNWRLRDSAPWMERWKWPFRYLMAVAFWNCVGAGLFGFLINPPIALYYMQGLNLTPLHGHTALFGVYGFLGLGFSLFCLRAAAPDRAWSDRWTGIAFWGLNIGLSLMVLLSLLPIGILQTMACIDHGLWWARSADFLYQPLLETLKWMRIPGDVVFAGAALILSLQFFRLVFASFSTRKETP